MENKKKDPIKLTLSGRMYIVAKRDKELRIKFGQITDRKREVEPIQI